VAHGSGAEPFASLGGADVISAAGGSIGHTLGKQIKYVGGDS